MISHLSIIHYVVYAGFLLTMANVYFTFKLRLNTVFAKLVQVFNLYLIIHFIFLWLVETVWLSKPYLDQMAPFSLLYGTFLYLSNYLTRHERISLRRLAIHLVVPGFFWAWFFLMLATGIDHTNALYVRMRMLTAIILLLGYILGTIFFNKEPMMKKYRFLRPIVISGAIVLVVMVIIAIRVATRTTAIAPSGVTSIRTVVYLCMLACAIMVFRVQLALLARRAEIA